MENFAGALGAPFYHLSYREDVSSQVLFSYFNPATWFYDFNKNLIVMLWRLRGQKYNI